MKMKPCHAVLVFAVLVVAAAASSIGSYHRMQRDIVCDMDKALVITLQERQDLWITPDTIQDYRSHLSIGLLKETSVLCYVVDDRRGRGNADKSNKSTRQLASRVLPLNSHAVQGYANCSFADVFGMSDQRAPLSLMLAAMLWAVWATLYYRRNGGTRVVAERAGLADVSGEVEASDVETVVSLGSLSYSAESDCFHNGSDNLIIRFTPMQHQLMLMFLNAPSHRLTKQDICTALWPKKPDASETLYTLIRRIKPIIEQNSNLVIESERGRAYRLVEKQ